MGQATRYIMADIEAGAGVSRTVGARRGADKDACVISADTYTCVSGRAVDSVTRSLSSAHPDGWRTCLRISSAARAQGSFRGGDGS